MQWQLIGNLAGKNGNDGKDADPIDVGSIVAAVLAQIPKPKDGERGKVDQAELAEAIGKEVAAAVAKLPPPKQGEPGKDAEPIHPDTIKLMVVQEVTAAIAAAPKPKDGEPGRDAAAIDPLTAIDETKSYPRGTWAKHAGGLWLARSRTDGMSGWDCIVDGVAAIAVAQGEDERAFAVTAILASGLKSVCEVRLPVMLYKGVWKEREYEHGDTVTWDGSSWHANKATTAKPGNGSPDWTMCNKRGNHGKDGKDGVGIQGKEGRPGRDLTQMTFDGVKY